MNRSRQDLQVSFGFRFRVVFSALNVKIPLTIMQLEAGKKLQQLHRRQLQLQHSVVVVQVRIERASHTIFLWLWNFSAII